MTDGARIEADALTEAGRPASSEATPSLAFTSFRARALLLALVALGGAGYLVGEWYLLGQTHGVFVGLLLAATAFLLRTLKRTGNFLRSNAPVFVKEIYSPGDMSDRYEQLIASVYDGRNMTIGGLLYGLILGASPVVLDVYGPLLPELVLGGFLFAVNFVTGIAFYGLIRYYERLIRSGGRLEVDLWTWQNPASEFILESARKISVYASIYCMICVSSILFSPFDLGAWALGYSLFAGVLFVSTLVVPSLPIIRKLNEEKSQALREIDAQIQEEFQHMTRTGEAAEQTEDLDQIETLISLRERVDEISVWPFKLDVVGTGAWLLLLAAAPTLLEIGLRHL